MNRIFRYGFLIAISLFTLHPSLRAQSATATLSGAVTDPAGANVAKATITLQNSGTGIKRATTTNSDGYFTLPLLPPGNYTLTVEQQGFATITNRDVILNVGDQRSLLIQLNVSGVAATVNVTDAASLLNESPSVGTVVNRQFVENLPLNGRSFQSLITLTPGVALTRTSNYGGGQFSVNGQRASANYFTVDGVSANIGISSAQGLGQGGSGALPGLSATGGTNNLVSLEALEEFRVQTSTFAPEFGRTPGGQVQIVTRAGTNDWHGSVFNYFRNDVLDANDWFNNRAGLPRPALRQNNFGGVLGGRLRKDKDFFFLSYEGLRLRQPQSGITLVPSRAARIAAPANVRAILNAYPLPNGRDFGDGTAEQAATYSNPSSLDAASLRLDHAFNDKVRIFGRYNYAPSDTTRRGAGIFAEAASLNNLAFVDSKTQTFTVGSTQIFGSRSSNDVRFNFSRSTAGTTYRLDDFGGAVPLDEAGLFQSSVTNPNRFFQIFLRGSGVPNLNIGREVDNQLEQLNLVNNLTLTKDSHTLKFGADYRRIAAGPQSGNGAGSYGQYIRFNGIGLTAAGTPAPAQSVLSGVANRALLLINGNVPLAFQNFSAYAQDAWRVNRRLTLVYGLRYDVNPAPQGRDGFALRTVTGLDRPASIALAPVGTPLYETTYGNFAPRVGASYQLSDKAGRETVLRGGFGVFYDLGAGRTADAALGFPYTYLSFVRDFRYPLTPAQAAPPVLDPAAPIETEIYVTDPQLQLPRTYQFNVTIDQSLGSHQTFTASYVGAVARNLLRGEYLYFPNPKFSYVVVTRNVGASDYHALQLQFQRRLSRGLQGLVSYTFAKSIDSGSDDVDFFGGTTNTTNAARADRGVSDFDVRHTLNAGLTYNLPAPQLNELGNVLLRGFALDATFSARSAAPVNLIGGFLSAGTNGFNVRPDLVAGKPLYLDDRAAPGGKRFNRAAFAVPAPDADGNPTRQGTLGRNVLRGFPLYQLDLALRRQFDLTERLKLQLRAEAFNVFNRANFGDPVADLNSSLFGQSTQTFGRGLGNGGVISGFNPLYQVGGPRSLQLSLKLSF
jgi:hypothetical protein